MHSSSSREDSLIPSEDALQPRRLQVALAGKASKGSSESDSSAAPAEYGIAADFKGAFTPLASTGVSCATGFGVVSTSASMRELLLRGSSAGSDSVVECLPLVQGGMERNSSKVSTRVLQQLQP